MESRKKIALLGSTGSIGTQAIEVIEQFPELLQIEVLTAYSNADLLIAQAKKCKPNAVVIGQENLYDYVKEALWDDDVKVFAGMQAINEVVQMDCVDMVLSAIVGVAGLAPIYKAIEANKQIALANKETLVVAGELMTRTAYEHGVNIYPVKVVSLINHISIPFNSTDFPQQRHFFLIFVIGIIIKSLPI